MIPELLPGITTACDQLRVKGSPLCLQIHDIFALDDCYVFSLLLWLFSCPVALLLSWISLVVFSNSVWQHDKIAMQEHFITVFGFWTKALWGRLFLLDWSLLCQTAPHCFNGLVLPNRISWGWRQISQESAFLAVPCLAKHCFILHK